MSTSDPSSVTVCWGVVFKIPRFLRFLAHELDGLHDIRLLVIIRVTQLGSPGEILV